ncbi:AAA family ATPase [Kitasatospora purpeofusca]|uniref:AAA family ATPase n=1 Tax=Kitasatospora purpeofusca TaxID=67352 RepID=UPI0035DEEFA8
MVERQGSTEDLWTWDFEDSRTVYCSVLRDCINRPDISRYLGHRGVSSDSLERVALGDAFVRDALGRTQTTYGAYRRAVSEAARAGATLRAARASVVVDGSIRLCVAVLALLPVWVLVDLLVAGGDLPDFPVVLIPVAAALIFAVLIRVRPAAERSARSLIDWARFRIRLRQYERQRSTRKELWTRTLRDAVLVPNLHAVIRHMLGPDRDSLLHVENHEGLRDVHDAKYVVASNAERLLRQKMDQLDGGTIAVCGPRGTGKSTLLRSCSTRSEASSDLAVFVQAPADYTPQDFLLTLFGEVCERYLKFHGQPTDAGVFVDAGRARRLGRKAWRALKWLIAFALAVVLLAAAVGRGLQWLYEHTVRPNVVDHLGHWRDVVRDEVVAFWTDHPWWAGIILSACGARLMPSMPRRRRGTRMPSSVQQCQRYLYRLRTVQNSTTAVNVGIAGPQGAGLGKSRTTSMSSVPLTFPELVGDFRELLAEIARDHRRRFRGARVVIAIDELDRVGSTAQARRFLGEIKAVFGIENVYYLISVAEDLGAAFARRGLPHRDVTDSSLDELLYVPPRTLTESKELLGARAPSITPPFVQLLHALSGGVPRDLIRYARRLIEVHHWTTRSERKELVPAMICDELGDTLEGFRTLMAAHQWTAESGRLLADLQVLVQALRSPADRDSPATRDTISDLAAGRGVLRAAPPAPGATPYGFSGELLTLWQEASVCAYFSLTLLEIFGAPEFEHLVARAAGEGRDGEPNRLAEARQELAVSPHSARVVLDDIRRAWGLPVRPL